MGKINNEGKENILSLTGKRREILENLLVQFRSSVAVTVLAGETGSGKTAVCYAVERQMVATHGVIFFSDPPQSFGDFIALLADKLKCNVESSSGAHDTKKTSEYCLEKLAFSSRKILLLCDDAEEIYLATLERILKFISRCQENGVDAQLMLAGKPRVLEAYRSLAISVVPDGEASLFILEPLCKKESGLFYQQLLGRNTQEGDSAGLSAEVLEKLYRKTEGNMKKISRIASRVAQTDESDASFFSLLSDIEGEERVNNKKLKRQVATQRKQQKAKNRARLIAFSWVVGAVVVGACSIFYFGGRSEVETAVVPVEQIQGEIPNIKLNKVAEQSLTPPASQVGASDAGEVTGENLDSHLDSKENNVSPEEMKEELALVAPKRVEKIEEPLIKSTALQPEVKEVVFSSPSLPIRQEDVVVIPVETVVKEVVDKKVAVLAPPKIALQPKKQIIEKVVQDEAKPQVLKKQQKIVMAPAVVLENSQPAQTVTAKQLYARSVTAGDSWKNRDNGLFYTLQLMVLTSDSAENHLQNYLEQDEYRAEIDKFRVLKRSQGEPALFVFYGEYGSAEQARSVRDSLPAFLQKHKPYLVTIDGALKKASL